MRLKQRPHVKTEITDKDLQDVPKGTSFLQHRLFRVFAVEIKFEKVSFKQCDLTSCYFRRCTFEDCDFTGAIMRDCNFAKSVFTNCDFRYSHWEKTHVEQAVLDTGLPSEFNLARDFVRSLRVNYNQIGNQEAVNKAASIEVGLTGKHLWHASTSKESYYRSKYKGLAHGKAIIQFFWWSILQLLWANGENPWHLVLWAVVLPICFSFLNYPSTYFLENLQTAYSVFLGLPHPQATSIFYSAPLTVARYIIFSLFVALLIRRYSRR